MLRKILTVIFCFLIIGSITGCAAISYQAKEEGERIQKEKVFNIKKGETTKREILKEFGPPTEISKSQEGEIFIYKHTRTSGPKFNFILGFGSEGQKMQSLMVFFDKNNIVSDFIFKP